jgi:hypothetical protein
VSITASAAMAITGSGGVPLATATATIISTVATVATSALTR